jgi:hypothetical protein
MIASLAVAPQLKGTFKMKRTNLILLSVATFAGLQPHAKAQTFVDLGAASSFAVLAGVAGISNAGVTTITGDIGAYPTPTITGSFNFLTGANHGGDSFTQAAVAALGTVYTNAAAQTPVTITYSAGSDLGGATLGPGIYYDSTSFGITGTPLTLNGGGNPNAVWIFHAGSTLTTSANISLINSAQAANVFWLVGTSATIGGTSFSGSVLALIDLTVSTGVTVDGRLLAPNGAVSLSADSITVPTAVPEPATTALIAAIGALGIAFWRRRRAAC